MNLYQKIKTYLWLRKQGFSRSYAIEEFKAPLTNGDFYAIYFIISLIAICFVLYKADEIDNYKITAQKQAQYLAHKLTLTTLELTLATLERDKNEKLVVSIYNGGIKENGRFVTFARLNAGSVCE